MRQPKIVKVVQGVHMGLGHDGLAHLLVKNKIIDVKKLGPGELVMCLNKKGDKLKVLGHQGIVLGYLRMPNETLIMPDALQYLPETFGGAGFDYAQAERKALEKRLAEVGSRRSSRALPAPKARA